MHIAGDMLFLWVFGPPVEDRLGIPKYLAVYFAVGIVGNLLEHRLRLFVFVCFRLFRGVLEVVENK